MQQHFLPILPWIGGKRRLAKQILPRFRLSWLRPKKDTPVSLLYHLAIGNLGTAAMNLAAQNAIPVIDANIIHCVH